MAKEPRGVSGKQRELFLSLTEDQQETYLHHFNNIGRPAAMAYRYTVEGWDTPDDARTAAIHEALGENLHEALRDAQAAEARRARIALALLQHRPGRRAVGELDGQRGVHLQCAGCAFGAFSPHLTEQADVAEFLEKARTADFPGDDLDHALAEHQAEVILRLL